jgi:hypothetical protein
MAEIIGLVAGITVIGFIASAVTDIIRAQNLPGTIENVVIPSVQPEVVYITPTPIVRPIIIRPEPIIHIRHHNHRRERRRERRRRESKEKHVS